MSEPKPEYSTKRGKGRPSNGEYPKKVFARITEAQHQHLKEKYEGDFSAGIRALIDIDMGVVPGKVIITLNPSTAQAIRAERPAGDEEGQELAY